jgi:hypothetical protein
MPLDLNVVSSQVALFPGKDLIDTITAALKLIYGGDPPVGVLKLLGYLGSLCLLQSNLVLPESHRRS